MVSGGTSASRRVSASADAVGEEAAVGRLDAGAQHAHADLRAGAVEAETEGFAASVEDPGERGAFRALETGHGAREDPWVAFADRLLAPRLEVDPDLGAGR